MSEKNPAPLEARDPLKEFDLNLRWPSTRLLGGPRESVFPSSMRWSPSMDVSETDSHYVATVELAGAKKNDVHVEVEDGVLTIRGEKKSEREDENEERRYTERSYGAFARSFTLPSNANEEAIEASFEDGVLKVSIGKSDEPKARAIQVH